MTKNLAQLVLGIVACTSIAAVGCEPGDATNAVVDNAFPPAPEGAPERQTAVFKVWWSVTLFDDAVAATASSEENRVVPASDYAYALLAPDWAPSSATPPPRLIPVRTREKVSIARGETGHITISSATIVGDCDAGAPLSPEDAELVTKRIFPGEFANVAYDPARCVSEPQAADAGDADAR